MHTAGAVGKKTNTHSQCILFNPQASVTIIQISKSRDSLCTALENAASIHALTNAMHNEHKMSDVEWFISHHGLVLIAASQTNGT